MAEEENGLAKLVECLDNASTAHSMKIKLMKNTSRIDKEIKINGQKLWTVLSFKYLGSVVSDEGSKPKTISRIAVAQITAALTRLKPVWNDRTISLSSKV